MNDGEPRTARLYAWIASDLDGVEGIITVRTAQGLLPLVVTDELTARSFKEAAVMAAKVRRTTAELVVFERTATIAATR